MAAFVRIVSKEPNEHMLVGFPGVRASLPRLEGQVEIRPGAGVSAPVAVSLVTIQLRRRESIHPAADSLAMKHLAAPRKEVIEIIGREQIPYQSPPGQGSESVYAMDLPFTLYLPTDLPGNTERLPQPSLSLPSRTAETYYEIVVSVQQGPQEHRKYHFPVPIPTYYGLSTWSMYNFPVMAPAIVRGTADHRVELQVALRKTCFGPHDPIEPVLSFILNPDWPRKFTKSNVPTIQKIAISIEEEITYNHEGDVPKTKTTRLADTVHYMNKELKEDYQWPEPEYVLDHKGNKTVKLMTVEKLKPAYEFIKDDTIIRRGWRYRRDADGCKIRARDNKGNPAFHVIPETKQARPEIGMSFPGSMHDVLPVSDHAFPYYQLRSFTTTASLYKIRFFLTVKADMKSVKDITVRVPIEVTPHSWDECEELDEPEGAIEQASRAAAGMTSMSSRCVPRIIRTHDWNAMHALGMTMLGNVRKPLIQ